MHRRLAILPLERDELEAHIVQRRTTSTYICFQHGAPPGNLHRGLAHLSRKPMWRMVYVA